MAKKKKLFENILIKNLLDGMKDVERVQVETKFNLASNIEKLLENEGINKSQFAERLGKSPSEISKWLSGKHNFTIDTLLEISHALKVDISELLKYKPKPLVETKVTVHKKEEAQEEDKSEKKDDGFDDYEMIQ